MSRLPTTGATEPDLLAEIRGMTDAEVAAWAAGMRDRPELLAPLIERSKSLVLGDLAVAERTCARLVMAADTVGGEALRARALTAHAHALAALSRFDESLAALEQAVRIAEASGSIPELAGALLVSVQPLSRRARLPRALEAATRAKMLFDSIGDRIGAAKACVNAGVVLRQLDDPEAAIEHFAQGREAFAGAPAVLAQIGSNTAEALLELNRFAEAEASFGAALEDFTRAGNAQAAAIVQGNLADLLNRQGRSDESLRAFEQAIRAFERAGSPGDLARLLTERAEVYTSLGLHEHAAQDLDAAIPQLRTRGMSLELTRALTARAIVHLALGEGEAAGAALDRALEGASAHPTALARAARIKAQVLTERGEPGAAARLLERAILSVSDRPAERAALLLELGRARAAAGDHGGAAVLLADAGALAEELGMPVLVAAVLSARAGALLADGRRRESLADYAAAMDALDRIRSRLPGEHSRVAFAGRWSSVYHDAAHALLAGDTLRERTAAFDAVERARSRALLDKVRGELDAAPGSAEDESELFAHHRDLLGELNALYASDRHARGPARLAEARNRAESCEQRLAAVEVRLAAARAYRGIFSRPATLPEVAASLGAGEALLQFAVIREQLWAFVVGPDGLRTAARLGPESEAAERAKRLEFQVSRWRCRAAADHRPTSPALGASTLSELARLHEMLVAPVMGELADVKRLVISPAGPVHTVPFEALQPAGGRPLLLSVSVSYTPSASMMLDLARTAREAGGSTAGNETIVIGAPDEQAPWIGAEARAVAAATANSLLVLGAEATASRFFEVAARGAQVHVACHGLAPDASPFSARLRLSDRWVTAREIAGARLGGGTVVLSGCETGRGVAAGAGELYGLVRAFLAAGASSVIATRWPVHDRHTMQLMLNAYGRLAGGRAASLPEALRAAQAEAAAAGAHPAIWAPFLLMGVRP